jgi:hypothetical protein
VTFDGPFKLVTVQHIPLYDGNPILKRLKPLRCANKRRHGMTALDRLAHEFEPNPSRRA